MFNNFYQQYLVLLTMPPRNSASSRVAAAMVVSEVATSLIISRGRTGALHACSLRRHSVQRKAHHHHVSCTQTAVKFIIIFLSTLLELQSRFGDNWGQLT